MALSHTDFYGEPLKAARQAGSRVSRRGGFSLIELVIVVVIIGIIAAIAIPRMSRGSAGAADAALVQNLSILRNAVEMYQTEHDGKLPAAATGVTVAQLLLEYSSPDGSATSATKSATCYLGPYLRAIPAATVGTEKGKNGIAVSNTAGTPATGTTGTAWLYNSVDGTVKPYTGTGYTEDSSKRAYADY